MDVFQPRLLLLKEPDGEFTLLSITLAPNTSYSAGRAIRGVPPNVRITAEVEPVMLQVRRRKGMHLPMLRPMLHRLANLKLGDAHGKTSVLAFVMEGDHVLGSASLAVSSPGQVCPSPGNEGGIQVETADWYAWVNRMPPGPPSFHVTGTVMLPSPAWEARLSPAVPQGINPRELILDLHLERRDGFFPEVVTPTSVRYDADGSMDYTGVLIREPDGDGVHIEVEQTF